MLEFNEIHFSYDKKKILEGVSFNAKKGEIVVLIGVSGSGKTTLFRLATGLLKPSLGTILVDEQPLSKTREEITYMQQEDLLLPWRNVLGNLLLFTELGKGQKRSPELIEKALALLERVGLRGSEYLYPRELSGGMRQRVALARSLLQNRPILLLDEPFGSLDLIIREELYSLIKEVRDFYQKTVVLVTHDFRDAISLADRILLLCHGRISHTFLLTNEMRNDPVFSQKITQKIREELSSYTVCNQACTAL